MVTSPREMLWFSFISSLRRIFLDSHRHDPRGNYWGARPKKYAASVDATDQFEAAKAKISLVVTTPRPKS